MEEKELIASNLVKYRKQAGLSQLQLAKKLNYSNKNISKWENGETTPSVFVLKEIAQVYNISLDDFFCEEIKVQDQQIDIKIEKAKKRSKTIFNYTMLLLANAIMFTVSAMIIYILSLVGVQGFNIWLLLLYMTPFSMLSVYIFIRVLYHISDLISLSLIGWLICLSLYLSFPNIENVNLIFFVAAAYNLISFCISTLINVKVYKKRKIKNKKENMTTKK